MMLLLALAAVTPAQLLAPLVGHCWRGTLPDGASDTHCFLAVDRNGVVDRHRVRKAGAAVYHGETAYRAVAGGVRFAYRNADGPVAAGAVQATADGLSFVPDAGPTARWRWRGRRAYLAEVGPDRSPVLFRRVR